MTTNEIEKKLKDIQNGMVEIAKVNKIDAEVTLAKHQRQKNRLKIIILIISILLTISVCINLYFLLAYEKVTETTETITTTFEGIEQTADNGGNNNIIGGDYNGNAEN